MFLAEHSFSYSLLVPYPCLHLFGTRSASCPYVDTPLLPYLTWCVTTKCSVITITCGAGFDNDDLILVMYMSYYYECAVQ